MNQAKKVNTKGKVAVGLSGGVDSAVSAWLLKEQGYEVVGVHLYCWPPKSEIEKDGMTRDEWIKKNGCRADEDRQMALKTALELDIPFKVLDFSEEYNQRVIEYFYSEYEKGRTPNPDVMCNSEIKFGLFLEWAVKEGFDFIATGHYAKREVVKLGGEEVVKLEIPKDKHKDQTYFLWKLGQEELRKVLLPLAKYLKEEVREMARETGLTVASRPDSQGICFIGKVDVDDFLKRRLREKKGKVVDAGGREVGEHKGVWFYTIGQRGGWQLKSEIQKEFAGKGETPVLYIVEKRVEDNVLVVGVAEEAGRTSFQLSEINWIGGKERVRKGESLGCLVRIRHGGELVKAQVESEGKILKVNLDKGQRGISSGQSGVIYKKGECLGGGVID